MGSPSWHFYEHLASFFLSISSYFFALLSFISSFIFRLRRGGSSLDNRFDSAESEEGYEETICRLTEADAYQNSEDFNDSMQSEDSENEPDKDPSEMCFKFRFPTYEEFINRKEENEVLITSSSCSKYEFLSQIEEPEGFSINVEVVDSGNENIDAHLEQSHCDVHKKEMESSDNGPCGEEDTTKVCADFSNEIQLQSEEESLVTDSDSLSIGFELMHGLMSRLIDSYSDGFLSDQDFEGEVDLENLHHPEMSEKKQDLKAHDNKLDIDVLEEDAGKFKHDHLDNLQILASEFLSESDFHEHDDETNVWEFGDEPMNGSQESEYIKSKNEAGLDSVDSNKLESLWEHQHLVEQLQMELKKVRATGLSTILEESEYSKVEDLKPWKIDEKFQRGNCMSELHKFYKSYRERMRKFDILTYQKMYAIGFLQKDPLQLLSSHKSLRPTLKSLLSQNLWLPKHKRHEADPMEKFIKELHSDLEVVYVGQMCLSWEFLNWQYVKALDLWDSDSRGVHRYNEVAGEFQQFQVLLERFIEDEPFQGTRVQHYIKRRCVTRNLLQVPVIRGDSFKDKKKGRKFGKGDTSITIDMIVEALEESIRKFWQFVKADKHSTFTTLKGQNADDLELFMEVTKSLSKKENMLKSKLRSENCILRRFRICREEDADLVVYFFSQVDMKLVGRVLNMSRLTTDQLVWCHEKLSRISFVQGKIRVEPSFLLFPC